jgi:glycosyltransferase involved in cell wall biosynthesis
VVLDTTVATEDRAGVGRYIDELAAALTRRGTRLALVVHGRDVEAFRALAPGAQLVALPKAVERRPVRLLWEQLVLPLIVRRLDADLLLSPHYTMPLLCGRPVVVTLHDATFFTHPELHEPLKRLFFRFWTRTSLRRARACLTPSAATKQQLVQVAGAREDGVVVAHLGVAADRFHVPDAVERASARTAIGVSGPYVAFLGTLEPRKNLDALIRGWMTAARRLDEPPALVLAGKEGWGEGLQEVVNSVPDDLRLVIPGYLRLDSLAGFLGEAQVVAYPSLGEGFGLPVLEAMSCGAAVLTTPFLSLPEVGGDAVAYTQPDAASIADALTGLLASQDVRARLQAAALQRARSFSWDNCAAVHQRVFSQVLGHVPADGR